MIRTTVGPLLVVLSLVLGGCATDQSASTGDGAMKKIDMSKPTGLLIEPVDSLKLGYSIDWATHLNVPTSDSIYSVTALGDLVAVVQRPSNVVTVISLKTGKQLWSQQVGMAPYRAFEPGRVGESLFVNTETQLFELDIPNGGKLKSRSELTSAVVTSPAIVGDMMVFGGADGMVFGQNTSVGYATWKYKMPGQILVPAMASGQQVFVVGIDGQYSMFVGGSGETIWRGRVFDKVTATPAIHASGVYVASEDHSLYAINRATGEDRWVFRYTDDLTQTPLVYQNTVYQPLPSGELIALKVTDGKEIWRLKTDDKLFAQDARGLLFNGGKSIVRRDPNSSKLLTEVPVVEKLDRVVQADGQALILVSPRGRVLKMSPLK